MTSGKDLLFEDTQKEALGYANKWTIDPEKIKNALSSEYYETNPDGSINIDLVLYFKPQIYQNIAITLALLTVVSSIGFLVFLRLKR